MIKASPDGRFGMTAAQWAQATSDLARRYARRLGPGGRDRAQDLAQEAALRAWAHPPPDGRVGPWMERIAANLLVDGWRRRDRADRATALWAATDANAAHRDEVALPLQTRQTRREVRRAVWSLPPALRRLVLARFALGRPYADVARMARVAEPTARSQVRRALARLRTALAGLRALVPPWLLPTAWPQHALVLAQPVAATALLVVVQVGDGAGLAMQPAPPAGGAEGRDRVERVVQGRRRPSDGTGPSHPGKPAAVSGANDARRSEPSPARHGVPSAAPVRGAADDGGMAAPTDGLEDVVREFVFDDDEVTGGREHPGGEVVMAQSRATHGSLIEIRASLRPEIVKTLEDLD